MTKLQKIFLLAVIAVFLLVSGIRDVRRENYYKEEWASVGDELVKKLGPADSYGGGSYSFTKGDRIKINVSGPSGTHKGDGGTFSFAFNEPIRFPPEKQLYSMSLLLETKYNEKTRWYISIGKGYYTSSNLIDVEINPDSLKPTEHQEYEYDEEIYGKFTSYIKELVLLAKETVPERLQ